MNTLVSVGDLDSLEADIAQLVTVVAMGFTLEQDPELCIELRRCAGTPTDSPLRVQLPIGQAGIEVLPDGGVRPIRPAEAAGAGSLDRYVVGHAAVRDRMIAGRERASAAARDILQPFFLPQHIPSRLEFQSWNRGCHLSKV
jgi:hypothetical protein